MILALENKTNMSKVKYVLLFWMFIILVMAVFSTWLAPFDPQEIHLSDRLLEPDSAHLLGTDQLGRDVYSRVLFGARYSLLLALTITFLEIVLGIGVGLLVGWYQGKVKSFFLWLANSISAFPSFMLALVLVAFFGQGVVNLIIAIVAVEWFYYARFVIQLVEEIKQAEFVEVAQMMNLPVRKIIWRHILPFVYKPVLVLALMNVGSIILMISAFSFLGLGLQPTMPEWGMMLHDARPYFNGANWLMWAPGLAIFATVASFNYMGEYVSERMGK